MQSFLNKEVFLAIIKIISTFAQNWVRSSHDEKLLISKVFPLSKVHTQFFQDQMMLHYTCIL